MSETEKLIRRYDAEIARLRESNAELVEALDGAVAMLAIWESMADGEESFALTSARAAIAKAKGEAK